MISQILYLLFSIAISVLTVQKTLDLADSQLSEIKTHFIHELAAHQCGRALSLIKNLKTAAARNLAAENDILEPQKINEPWIHAAARAIENIKKHYEDNFEFLDHICHQKSDGHQIATSYLLNSDEDDPMTGYYSYELNTY